MSADEGIPTREQLAIDFLRFFQYQLWQAGPEKLAHRRTCTDPG
jgi:hypothetical protein